MPVFATYCESHASDIPFHVVARLLRATMGIERLDAEAARACARERFFDADPEDLLLLDDLLGIADPAVALPEIAPDARRRRLTALIIGASLARAQPAVYVIDDAHWIDEVSESMLADFLAVIPQTPALTLITYRPEYHGALADSWWSVDYAASAQRCACFRTDRWTTGFRSFGRRPCGAHRFPRGR